MYANFNTDLIAYHDWWVEGDTTGSGYDGTALDVYNIDSSSQTTYNSQIALMYASDLAYAASPAYWNGSVRMYQETILNNYLSVYSSGFLLGFYGQTAIVYDGFNVIGEPLMYPQSYRPTFYLVEDALIAQRTGTVDDPFVIAF